MTTPTDAPAGGTAAGLPATIPFRGLRTAIYPTPDLAASKAWYTALLGSPPSFDEPFYVGFDVAGYELGLLPEEAPTAGAPAPLVYWGVDDVADAVDRLVASGATVVEPVTDVGEGIRTASVADPAGHRFGLIENPHDQVPTTPR